ncbi:MAG: discoidin domain-containing protein [Rubrivivax sp.]|nr:discoidin domain-containing protein [Rubrivivax sp.]
MIRPRLLACSVTLLTAALLAACGGGGDATSTAAPAEARQRPLAVIAPSGARWSPAGSLPLVPAAMANLPDGKVLLWSAEEKFSFGGTTGRTYFATFDPANGTVTERSVTETGHNMFCPGTTNLADGRLLVNGGISSTRTSLFNPANGAWTIGPAMSIARGYQANTLLKDGSVLTLGGSWSGGVGNKNGEVWTATGGWQRKTGIPIDPMLSVDNTRNFGMDSHFMLLPAGNGKVFHAGPGVNMHWISTEGNGSVVSAGPRGDDEFSVSGNTVMYDTGKILKTGGGPGYDSVNANNNSYVIDINNGVTVRKLAPMAYRRAFHNSVVLPNGQVVIVGGQTFAVGFSDNNSVLVPELFDPVSETFSPLPPISVPRNYHSVAILLPDGRVLSAGGGLCGAGCAANHPDLQILTPHYLIKPDGTPATRPVITAAPASVRYGQSMTVSTDSAVSSFAMVRLSSTTHTVNNDQRRLSLSFRSAGTNSYSVDVPTNPGWALPGDWMLFAMNADGTPSVARIVRIALDGSVQWNAINDQASTTGASVALQPAFTAPGAAAPSFSASGLPSGLAIDASTGRISGTPSSAGTSRVTVRATVAGVTTSTDFRWTVQQPGQTRFVRLEALSEVAGNPWTSAAEINLVGVDGQPLARSAWQVSASSQEVTGENGAAANAIDGNPATIWHTQWQAANPAHPHSFTINLGIATDVTGLRVLPRQDVSNNGMIARFNVYRSSDGVNWGNPVASGNLADLGVDKTEKTVWFNNLALGKAASQSSDPFGGPAARAVDGNVDGNWAAGSVAHTNSEANAWWEVDLGSSHALNAVRLWNRTDCCGERLSNFYLLVSDTPMQGRSLAQLLADATVWRSQYSGIAPRNTLISTANARGRYVRVQLAGTNFLHLAEVQVHGQPAVNRPPSVVTPSPQTTEQGVSASLSLSANDPDGDLLTWRAAGLPAGLSIAPGTGVISGAPSAAGSFNVTITVDDSRGGSAAMQFPWTVTSALPQIQPVLAAPIASGGTASYSAETSLAGSYSYQWTFGDGSTSGWSTSNTVSHVYAAPGLYLVTVAARTADGRVSTRSFWQAVEGTKGLGGRSSTPVLVEPRNGTSARIWAVNPDNDSVSVFDSATRQRVAEIAVGSAPRTLALAPDGRVWVANKGSATLSILNAATLALAQTVSLPRASQPYGIVIGTDGTAHVTLEASGAVVRVAANGTPGTAVSVGPNPRHLALNAAGSQLLVSRFVTPPLPGEGTATVQPSATRGAELLVLDAATLALQRTIVLQHSEKADNTVQGRGIPNYLGAPVIAPDGRSAWVPSKQDNIQRGKLRDGLDLDFQNTLRAISSRIDLATQAEDLAARIDHDNSGIASSAVFHPGGNYLFVALEASRHVAVVDAIGKRELFRVDVGRAPQGLAVSADGLTLYVQNFMDRTVGVHDLTRLLRFGESSLPLQTSMASVATERLSAAVLRGKQFFYDARDPRLSRDAYISCAACHNDGGHDGRVWDFTGFGEGLRNTISLQGRAGAQGRLHWSANFDEVQDFEGQIRRLAQGTGLMSDAQFNTGTRSQPLGDRKSGISADLDALAAYVGSLNAFAATPWRQADGTLTAAATAGRTVFANSCASCHGGTDYSDSASNVLRNIGTLKPGSGSRLGAALTGIDTPTLRDAWATAPYLHDGSAATLEAAIGAHSGLTLSATELGNVLAFVRQIGREEPAVPAGGVTGSGTGLRGRYFANLSLSGNAVLTRTEAINFDWGTGAPATGVPADNFSVRWDGEVQATVAGSYRFQTISDDGVRLYVNGALLINNWTDHAPAADTSAALTLAAGQRVSIVMEYYERGVGAVARLNWIPPGASAALPIPAAQLYPATSTAGAGLRAQYFGNTTLSGAAVLTRSEAVDFDWGNGAPGPGVTADNFSVRWTGTLLVPTTGSYRFATVSDDGVRLWVNGQQLVNNWTVHAPTTNISTAVSLTAGQRVTVTMEYFEQGGGAMARLLWLPPGTSEYRAIPAGSLYLP